VLSRYQDLKIEAIIKHLRVQLQRFFIPRHVTVLALLSLLVLLVVDAVRFDLTGPSPSYFLLDRHGTFIAEIADEGQDYGYWPVKELPPRVVAAALALEDKRFGSHPGVDPLAVGRALYQNITQRKRVSGASTIAMQVARLLDPGERSYWHKLIESWRAMVLTARYGRNDILAAYLRLVPYGNRVHGIAYAARRYLDKPVEDLSWAEIAYLSAIPQAPTHMNPYREDGRQRAIARGGKLLQQLLENGVLTAAEHELAQLQISKISFPKLITRSEHSLHAIFKLKQVLAETPPYKGSEPYRINTTLDLEMQDSVKELAGDAVSLWKSQGVGNAAVVLLDRESNGVLAWLGSTDYFNREQAGALDYAQTMRSPGSALKPFLYALALDQNKITPATILDDLPSVSFGVVNADRTFLGPLLPRQALANSRNVPVARLLNDIGLEEGYAFLRDLGLHHDEHDARRYGLGLSIGAMPVTLEHLVQAYSVLANDGRWRSLNWYTGQVGDNRQLLTAGTARLVTLHLSDPSARLPSFPRMGSTEYAFPVALKTGTSEGLRDAWTVAYSRRYIIGVWLGHPDARPMHEITGASGAAELARRILGHLHGNEKQGLADLSFPPPQGYHKVAVCAMTGKRASRICDPVFEEWFKPGQEPQQEDDAYQKFAIDRRNGLLAHARTPARYVEQRTFIHFPPRYADWAAQAGYPHVPQKISTLGETGGRSFRTRVPVGADALAATAQTKLKIVAPTDGLKLLRDPSLPASLNTIGLRAEISSPMKEVLWEVDGKPYQLAKYPYTVRWTLQPGEHVIRVRSALTEEVSRPVRIRVE
jgi:penicillin-binding protein 1C